jgi:hypothetical protein
MAEDPGDGMVGLTWSTKPAIGWPALAAVDDSTVQVGPQFFNASAATPTPGRLEMGRGKTGCTDDSCAEVTWLRKAPTLVTGEGTSYHSPSSVSCPSGASR